MALCFLVLCVLLAVGHARKGEGEDHWVQMPGSAIQLSAKGAQLWALLPTNRVAHWNGASWIPHVGARSHQIAATPDGFLWGVHMTHDLKTINNVVRRNKDNPQAYWNWEAAKPVYAFSISAKSANEAVLITNERHVHQLTAGGVWKNMNANDVNSLRVAIGVDGDMWKLDANGFVYHYSNGNWDKQETEFLGKWIEVENGKRVVVTDLDHSAIMYDGRDWIKLGGNRCSQATIGTSTVYCIDDHNRIWKLDV